MPTVYFLIFDLDNSKYVSFEEYKSKVSLYENLNEENIYNSSELLTKSYEISKTVKI